MKVLRSTVHADISPMEGKSIFKRIATRAICLQENNILLLYTERYQDYSLPGGGVDADEDIKQGLVRELSEETGAQNIRNIQPFGIYEEFRPWYRPEFDMVHMLSHCYTCDVDTKLGETRYEEYEKKNGMRALWININEAIAHNEATLLSSTKAGLSIEREIFLLKLILKELCK